MQPNNWVDPKYERSKLQRDNPPVGGLFCCLRYEYINPCTACELDHRGKRTATMSGDKSCSRY